MFSRTHSSAAIWSSRPRLAFPSPQIEEALGADTVVDGHADDAVAGEAAAVILGRRPRSDTRTSRRESTPSPAASADPRSGDQMLRFKQSSPGTGQLRRASRLIRGRIGGWGGFGPKARASRTPLQGSTGCGGRSRLAPNGGAAYGMPLKVCTPSATLPRTPPVRVNDGFGRDRRRSHQRASHSCTSRGRSRPPARTSRERSRSSSGVDRRASARAGRYGGELPRRPTRPLPGSRASRGGRPTRSSPSTVVRWMKPRACLTALPGKPDGRVPRRARGASCPRRRRPARRFRPVGPPRTATPVVSAAAPQTVHERHGRAPSAAHVDRAPDDDRVVRVDGLAIARRRRPPPRCPTHGWSWRSTPRSPGAAVLRRHGDQHLHGNLPGGPTSRPGQSRASSRAAVGRRLTSVRGVR